MRSTLIALVIVGGLLWLWMDARRSHEQAVRVVRRALKSTGAQLLDDTVALQSIGLARTPNGRMALRRTYGFELSFDRLSRQRGSLTLMANAIQVLDLPPEVDPDRDGRSGPGLH